MTLFKTLVSWSLSVFVAFVFLQAAVLFKFADPPGENVIFATLAQRSGIQLFEPMLRYAVGAAEGLAALAILIPPSRPFGALLAVGVLLGAIGFHLSPWLGLAVPVAVGATETDGGGLFGFAVVTIVAAGAVVWLERGRLARGLRRLGLSAGA
ncbi:MAG: hypothetical protein ACFB2Z_02900 [Maricaulaceae bacterium]